MRYAVYLHLELLDIVPARGRQREKIFKFIRSLAENPFTEGDFTDQDASLRRQQIKIIGDFAITYRADHPAKTVMIIDVSLADK